MEKGTYVIRCKNICGTGIVPQKIGKNEKTEICMVTSDFSVSEVLEKLKGFSTDIGQDVIQMNTQMPNEPLFSVGRKDGMQILCRHYAVIDYTQVGFFTVSTPDVVGIMACLQGLNPHLEN